MFKMIIQTRDAVKSQILSTPLLPEEAMLTRENLSSIRIDQEGKTMVEDEEDWTERIVNDTLERWFFFFLNMIRP